MSRRNVGLIDAGAEGLINAGAGDLSMQERRID